METLGNRIRVARLDKGLTQQKLADLIVDTKINKARIAQYECDNRVPKQPTLRAIAEVLDTSTEWLLNGDLDNDCPEISLGKRIKQIREAKGMSRSELGKALELNNPDIRIGSYENGKKFPRMPMLKKIAIELGVSWQWLMTGRIDAVTYMTMNELGMDSGLSKYDAVQHLLEINRNSISDKQLNVIIKCFNMIGII